MKWHFYLQFFSLFCRKENHQFLIPSLYYAQTEVLKKYAFLSWRHKDLRFCHLSLFVTASYGVCLLSLWIEIDRFGFPRGQSCCSGKHTRMSFHLSFLFQFGTYFRCIWGFWKIIVDCVIRLIDSIHFQRFFPVFLLNYMHLASYKLGTPPHGTFYCCIPLKFTIIREAVSVNFFV